MELSFEPLFGGYFWTSALIGLLALVWLFIRSDRQLTFGQSFMLKSLRLLAIAVLCLMFLRPVVTMTEVNESPSTVAVMIDTSSSMDLPSGISNKSRYAIERQVIDDLKSLSSGLGKQTAWEIYGYDSRLLKLSSSSVQTTTFTGDEFWDVLPKRPEGMVTDVGKSLADLIETPHDPPLISVVWLGDGAQTVRSDTSQAQHAARTLTQLDVPLLMIGVGPRSGAELSRDQAVEGVADQIEASAKSTVSIRGTLKTIGLENQELQVVANLIPSGKNFSDPPQVLQQTQLKPDSNEQTIPFSLLVQAPEHGLYQIQIKAIGVDGEATLLNNEQTCFLNVRDRGSRVLYLEGSPRPEQKFIRQAIAGSGEMIQIDFAWAPESRRSKWPLPLKEQIETDTYGCVILGDIDYDALGPETTEQLVRSIERGAGLITIGGFHAYSSGGYATSPLASILPVQLNPAWRQNFEQPDVIAGHLPEPVEFIPRSDHPILDIDRGSFDAWKKMRPLLGANRWLGIAEKPGVQWIAQSQRDEPLVVAGEAGKGRILSIAFDSTYLWALQGQADMHRRFWRQSVLWTMRQRPPVEGLQIDMDRRSFNVGESTLYSVSWNPGANKSSMPENMNIRWTRDGKDLGPLVPKRESDLLYQSQLGPFNEPGRHEIVVRAQLEGGIESEVRLPFVVMDLALEKIQSIPDWQLISQLASLNLEAGGQVISPEDPQAIIEAIKKRRATSVSDLIRTYKLGDGPIDSWIVFTMFAVLLCWEWGLRKKWNLP